MKTNVKRLLFVAPILAVIVIVFNSFKPAAGNHYANGGGIADGVHFNFNAVEQKDGTYVGHLQWNGTFYRVLCVQWGIGGSSAIIYTDGGVAFMVVDNGEGTSANPDTISDPVDYYNHCGLGEALEFTSYEVTSGNIQIK